jgi:cytochrome P450
MTLDTITTTRRDRAADARPISCDENGIWHVTGYAEARAILLADVLQAGFQSETMRSMPTRWNPPVLFQDGEAHREQRRQTARFFSPTAIQQRYRPLMERAADRILEEGLYRTRRADLNLLSARMATMVIAELVGLTESPLEELTGRLNAILSNANEQMGTGIRHLPGYLKMNRLMAAFMRSDVRPAIQARRTNPREDVISHLISQGRSDTEIMIECITYGSAGMVTTQEFMCVAAWHMLKHPEIRESYLNALQEERTRMLNELLRLEPVVGHLKRRAASDLDIPSGDQTVHIPAGALIDLNIFEINRDEAAMGGNVLEFDPERQRAKGVSESGMSFGSGPHRCAGEFLALAESDIFLTHLLANPTLHIVQEPRLGHSDLTGSYQLREFMVTMD